MRTDAEWMEAAARLSLRARPMCNPNPNVGCLIVKRDVVLARGWTQATGRPHAEAHALCHLEKDEVTGSTVYVTLEPCAHHSDRGPCCADILAQAKPARVVIGVNDPDVRTAGAGQEILKAAGIEVDVLDHPAACESLSGFFVRQKYHRPYITIKLAMSEDGFISQQNAADKWITQKLARNHVHTQRAKQDGILVGRSTWDEDKPSLDVRLPGLEGRSPKRYLLTKHKAPENITSIASLDEVYGMDTVQYLYIEGGASTAQSFYEEGLVDQIDIYTAPYQIGNGIRAPDPFHPKNLESSPEWELTERRQLGSDCLTVYRRI